MARRLAFVVLVLTLLLPGTALAVWGGTPDGTDHPGIGAMYFDFDGSGEIEVTDLNCSGSYAGPTKAGYEGGPYDVFLLAGHCLPPAFFGIPAQALFVSYDNNEGAADIFDTVSGLIQGQEYHQMPGFGQNRGDLRDLGVILLPAGSAGGAAAIELPPAGYLDDLKRSKELKRAIVDVVGYGVTPIWNEPGRTNFDFDGIRKAGTSVVNGLNQSNVLYNQNPNGIGTGSGVCFGDSGSPQLLDGTLMAISVTSGGNGQCNSVNYNYRLDTSQAREFLGQFLDLP